MHASFTTQIVKKTVIDGNFVILTYFAFVVKLSMLDLRAVLNNSLFFYVRLISYENSIENSRLIKI